MTSTLARLRNALPTLPPVLERIGAYAVQHPERVVYQTVTELAEASGASEASIIRFCRNLGYGGFQELKLALAVDLANAPSVVRPDGPPRSTADLVRHVVEDAQLAVSDTGKLIDPDRIEAAARRLLAARRVDVYGVGASGIVADYFHYKLVRLGLAGRSVSDPHMASMSAASLSAEDVAVGISSSGSIVDTVQSLRQAQAAGAYTIAVTNRARSPLAGHAEMTLVAANPESPLTGGAVLSKIGQLLLLEALFNVMLRLEPKRADHVRATAEAVVEKSY